MRLVFLSLFFTFACSKIYFSENADEGYKDRWVQTKDTSATLGVLSRELKQNGADGDYCLKMMNDSSYYRVSAVLSEPLDLSERSLYVQFSSAYVQEIDCGGSYFKFYDGLQQELLNADTVYNIMFGPDACGYGTKKLHLILHHKGVNYEIKNPIPMEIDDFPHFYQLYIGTDGKFTVKVDAREKASGLLVESFNYLAPKLIDDPSDKKPKDWVDEEMMDDSEDKKPEDYDDRQSIPDEEAIKPSDWDDATDGEWEPDLKTNPNYKGNWEPKKVPNPGYKGIWKAKQISNPEYKPDDTFAKYRITHLAFEDWTVKSKTEFDNIFITDNEEEAEQHSLKALAEVNSQADLIRKLKEKQKKPDDASEKVDTEPEVAEEDDSGQKEDTATDDAHGDL